MKSKLCISHLTTINADLGMDYDNFQTDLLLALKKFFLIISN